MKWPAVALGASGILCAAMSSLQTHRQTMVVITGDIAGYLSPCGCTSPMMGGITRQASLIRQLRRSADVVLLVNGALTGGVSKQNVLKVETLAQTFGALDATAVNLSPEDAKLGLGLLQSVQNLSEDRLLTGSIEPIPELPIHSTAATGDILVGGVSMHPENLSRPLGAHSIATEVSIQDLLRTAREGSNLPVLLLDGTELDATNVARKFPDIKLIVYRSTGDAPRAPLHVGHTLLVTPGQFGKSVVSVTLDGQEFGAYQVTDLDPEYPDDAQVGRFYREYLKTVDQAGFIDKTDRVRTAPFAGSQACAKCHQDAYKTWAHSRHFRAFFSLEAKGHGRDPDCVKCHVVGLTSVSGYRSRLKTPNLANVGCESCHGPAALHAKKPSAGRLPKVGTAVCLTCHTPDQSPGFKFKAAWQKISH